MKLLQGPLCASLILTFLCIGVAHAATLLVLPDGTGDAPTIQAGIDSAALGDTVLLANGTFSGPGNRDIDYGGKDVVVASVSGNPLTCIIDCDGSDTNPHRGFLFQSSESPSAVLNGVTVRNGYVLGVGGGALKSVSPAKPSVSNCVFENNTAPQGGGILCLGGVSASISNCSFDQNVAGTWGGGVYYSGSFTSMMISIHNCSFTGNSAGSGGGGLYMVATGAQVVGSVFTGNSTTGRGGAVYCLDVGNEFSDTTFLDCSFNSNSASTRGGAVAAEWDYLGDYYVPLSFVGCEFTGNSADVDGGAIYAWGAFIWGPANWLTTFRECTMFANSSPGTSGIVMDTNMGTSEYRNTIIAGGIGGPALNIFQNDYLYCMDIYANEGGDWVGAIAGDLGINGNISADPLFCDTAAGILTLDAASPCLNAPGCGQIGAYGQGCDVVTSISSGEGALPQVFALYPNTPNPFNPATTIRFSLPRAGKAKMTIHDVTGRLVATVVDGEVSAGDLSYLWRGRDAEGREVPSGIYFARLQAGNHTATRKMVLLR